MLFQVLCGFEPVFYTTHPNEEPEILAIIHLATCLFIFQLFPKTLVYPFEFLDLFLQFLKIFNEFVVFLFT